jgi:hypothetical protein
LRFEPAEKELDELCVAELAEAVAEADVEDIPADKIS